MRLIDADALKKEFDMIASNSATSEWQTIPIKHIKQIVDNAPTVEEVSIIEFKEPLPPVKAHKILKALNKRPQGEWIPVSKSWPAFTGLYLVSVDDLVTVANFTGAYFINKRGLMLNVSAWQLLPEPYKN